MSAHSGEELDLCWSVRLIRLEVQKDADGGYADELEEVDAEEVRLRAVGLPEVGKRGVTEGRDTVAGFGGADGP